MEEFDIVKDVEKEELPSFEEKDTTSDTVDIPLNTDLPEDVGDDPLDVPAFMRKKDSK